MKVATTDGFRNGWLSNDNGCVLQETNLGFEAENHRKWDELEVCQNGRVLHRLVNYRLLKKCAFQTLNRKIHNFQSLLFWIVFGLVFNCGRPFKMIVEKLGVSTKLSFSQHPKVASHCRNRNSKTTPKVPWGNMTLVSSSFALEIPMGFSPIFPSFARMAQQDLEASKAILLKALEDAIDALETQEVPRFPGFSWKNAGFPGENGWIYASTMWIFARKKWQMS